MRKHFISGLAAMAVLAASSWMAPAHAVERGGLGAGLFQTATVAVGAGQSYDLVCGFTDFPRRSFIMVTDRFEPADGGEGFKGVTRFSGSANQVRATGKASKWRFDQEPPSDHAPSPGVFGSSGTAPEAGTITKSWATWGISPSFCNLTVGGTNQAITNLDGENARIVDLAEFDGGASIQLDPVITAGALQKQARVSQGHLSAILDVSSTSGSTAQLRVDGPEGQSYESVSLNPFVWVDEPNTSGEWTYGVTGVQSQPQFPALWTMELPGN